ncbi:hypothetical protein L9F63_001199 [Diploptera punctata]|uniref:Uncharacterized protein n=1 Tax=Diploptera punctata TaxID=6984 RepID=A0AAD8EJ95_DIPPU|nr:hypothetical protein L9F63_001199 [Diploptera punctata]
MSEENKNEPQEQNTCLSPNGTQSARPIIPMTVIPKIDNRPNLSVIETKPETSSSPYRLVPIQNSNERKTVNFSKSIINNPGCSVLDLIMPAPSQIVEIVFRNFYTAWITILVYFEKGTPIRYTNKCLLQSCNKVIGPLPGQAKPMTSAANENENTAISVSNSDKSEICEWIVALPRYVLMPNPHYEKGSQDIISIKSTECFVVLKDVKALRLILRQPSPMWLTSYVEELNIYSNVECSTMLRIPNVHPQVYQNSPLALLRCQTMGAIFKRYKIKANAPNNMEIPTYEFFSLTADF